MYGKSSVIKKFILKVLQSAALVGLAAFSFIPLSCRPTREGIKLIHLANSPAVIKDFQVTGKDSARIAFSGGVVLNKCKLMPEIAISGIEYSENPMQSEDCINYFADYRFENKLETGKLYKLSGTASDKSGNTLTFSIPIEGFNDEVPSLEITEVHNRKGTAKDNSVPYPKEEFIEIFVKSDGNLAGLEIFSADKNRTVYKFPAIKVKRKEIIVVHLTNENESGNVNEDGDAVNLSKTRWYSSDKARDLWNSDKKTCLGKDCDVILLRNRQNKVILDAFVYAPSTLEDWSKDSVKIAAEQAASCEKWSGEEIRDAVKSDGISPSKSFIKTGKSNNASSWAVTKSRGETAGRI